MKKAVTIVLLAIIVIGGMLYGLSWLPREAKPEELLIFIFPMMISIRLWRNVL